MKHKPKKPTEPFGYISFGKNGAVSKHIFELSKEKEEQEIGAVERFIAGINQLSDYPNINGFEKLPEADHGRFGEITHTEVVGMVLGVRALLDKHLP